MTLNHLAQLMTTSIALFYKKLQKANMFVQILNHIVFIRWGPFLRVTHCIGLSLTASGH